MKLRVFFQTLFVIFSLFFFTSNASADPAPKKDLWDDVDMQATPETKQAVAQDNKPDTKTQYANPEIQMWAISKARDMYREQPPEETFRDFRQGSVDFWVKYDPEWKTKDDSGTIVALSNGYDTLFEFSMSAEGDAIYMENSEDDAITGAKSRRNAVNFDFKDDLIHHVALITDGKLTRMHVDGRLVGQFSLGYAIPTDAQGQRDDLQLSIGSLDGRKNKFQGQVGAVRIWGIPLDANLLLKAAFMRDDELLNQAWAKSFLIAYLGNEAGHKSKPIFNIMPESFRRPEGVWMANNQKERKQKARSSFVEQFKSVDGVPLNYEYEPQAYTQILVVPRDSELARYASANPGVSSGNQASSSSSELTGYSKMAGKFMKGVAMAPAVPKTLNECANTCSSSTKCTHFNYIGNTCYLISEEIAVQSFPTNSVLYTKLRKSTQVNTATNDNTQQDEATDLESPLAVQKPRKAITDKELPVMVALSFDPNKGVANQVTAEAYEATSERNHYKSATSTINVNGVTSLSKNNVQYERTSSLGLPKKTDTNVDDVFIVANQIRNKKTVLYGYDPLFLDPFTLGDPGIKKQIFEHTKYGFNNGANRVVPLGLDLIDIQSGEGRVKTREAMSQSSIQEMLGGSVSSSFDINTPKGGGSFSANANFKTITDTSQGVEKGYTFAQSHQTRFIVLLDKSKIGLSQNFKDAVLLAARTPSPANAKKLVEDYGTHYAHAVAMGGRIIQMLEFSKEEWGQGKIYEGGLGLAVEARIGPKEVGVTAKGALGVDASSTAKFESKVSSSNDKWKFVGGSQTGKGLDGWGVTDETTTPIFLDLRVLSEVLAPPFFTDPKVFNTLRPMVYQEILAYVQRNKGPLSTANLVPKELVVGSTLILEKKSCAAEKSKTWRLENNTDDKLEGGGVWARFSLPAKEHNQSVSYKAGCIAGSHFDGPIDAALECNRVCWENTQMICDDGKWKEIYDKKPNQVFSKDLLCHSTGEIIQEHLEATKGTSPWKKEESWNAYLKALEPACKALPKGMAGRPADCRYIDK